MNRNEEREPTPFTAPKLFRYEAIDRKKVAIKISSNEVWEADLLHGSHYEVYASKNHFQKGIRNRAV